MPEIPPVANELKIVIYNKSDFAWAEQWAALLRLEDVNLCISVLLEASPPSPPLPASPALVKIPLPVMFTLSSAVIEIVPPFPPP